MKGQHVGCVCGHDDENVKQAVKVGKFPLFFFTPEALANRKWWKVISSEDYQKRIKGLVIDEAHTIKKMVMTLLITG